MIYLLEEQYFSKIIPLIGNYSHSLFPGCVCKGDNPGWIYVDDPKAPTSAFVYMKKLGGTLVGNSNNNDFIESFKKNLDKYILPRIKEEDDFFSVTGSTELWNSSIERILENKKYDKSSVLRYNLKDSNITAPRFNKGIEIVEIVPELFNNNSIVNISSLKEDIITWWGNIDRFLDRGCGFVGLKNNEVCGWSYSVCIFDSRVEIYIETAENYRNKGIGTAIAHRFINYCLDNNLIPQWEAMSDNEYSHRIAQRIGFELDYEYKLFDFEFN